MLRDTLLAVIGLVGVVVGAGITQIGESARARRQRDVEDGRWRRDNTLNAYVDSLGHAPCTGVGMAELDVR